MSVVYQGPSKIHGTGVFASANLPAGLVIPIPFRWCDPEVNDSFEGGMFPRAPFRYLNHSVRPNCEVFSETDEDLFLLVLSRVRVGAELTIDYGKDYWQLNSTM